MRSRVFPSVRWWIGLAGGLLTLAGITLIPPAVPARGHGDAAVADETATVIEDYLIAASRPGQEAAAAAIGARLLDEHADDALVLDSLAWAILTDETVLVPDLPLALAAARRAHSLTGDTDAEVLETLARGLLMNGRRDEAIAVHRQAIAVAAADPSTRLVLEEILAEYLDPPPSPGLSDQQQIQRLEAELRKLVAVGKSVAVADLLDRAGVAPCRAELSAPADQPLSSEQLFAKVQPSVVVMASLEPTPDAEHHDVTIASGFVIDATGIVVTNFHVVNAPDSPILAAMTATGEVVPVTEILAVSPLADIAICRIAKQGLPPLACLADARPGCRLHALSHPDAAFYSLTEGILSRYFVHRADGQAKRMFTTTVDFAVGSSGGPLVDDCGNVVGIVSSTLAIYAEDELPADAEPDAIPAADFQMGLNMCVPAADILRLVGGPGKGEQAVPR
jgi:serine protease Do